MKILSALLLLFCVYSNAQEIDFSSTITKDKLSANANSIVQFDDLHIEIESFRKMNYTVTKAVTVLNKSADDQALVMLYYDNNTHIKNLKTILYDGVGNEVKKITKNKFTDVAAADGISLYNDNRVKYYRHVSATYPYTVYYEYEIETSNTAFIPSWSAYGSYDQSVLKSSYSITFPTTLKVQHVENNFKGYTIKKEITPTALHYAVSSLPAIDYEQYSPSISNYFPNVKTALNQFSLEGFKGEATDWKSFGSWMYQDLLKSRMDLPEATKKAIQNLVAGVDDPIERAKIVYEYVQNKTRYISVQVGIGGWMPMLASEVDKVGYGDCKALTNYTKTLMDAAGVESYYTAVHAGTAIKDIDENLVSIQGNHVILYLPTKGEDIWLECTSQSVPFGYQGTFTDDRNVVIMGPDGGKIKHTNITNFKDNYLKVKGAFSVSADGHLTGDVKIKTGGTIYNSRYGLETSSDKDVLEYYKDINFSHINNLKIENYEFENVRDSVIFYEKLKLSASDYASFSENRMLLNINAFNRLENVPKRYRNRKLPIEIERGFLDEDDVIITIPTNYKIDGLPSNISIENVFGSYETKIEKIDEQHIKYLRKVVFKKGYHEPSAYKDYRDFRKQIVKYDKAKIVLLKNQP